MYLDCFLCYLISIHKCMLFKIKNYIKDNQYFLFCTETILGRPGIGAYHCGTDRLVCGAVGLTKTQSFPSAVANVPFITNYLFHFQHSTPLCHILTTHHNVMDLACAGCFRNVSVVFLKRVPKS